MTIFVLPQGNWHVGPAWDGVSRRLEELGHITHTPTLPGHGQQVATGSGYQDAADNVARYIAERDLRDIVLVGHSGGGIAISKAVELIADRAKRLVYLAMAANKSREFAGTIPRMDSPSLRTQPLRGTVILRDQRKGNAAYVAVPSLEKSIRRKPLVRHQGRIARIM